MRHSLCFVIALLLTTSLVLADKDGFRRERRESTGAAKDALEGNLPPSLEVSGWINTANGEPIKLADLKGKVVLIDFWGVW